MKEKLLGAAYLIIITLIAGFILACGIGIVMDKMNPPHPVVVYQSVTTPTVTPIVTASPADHPEFITYTVRSTDPTNLKVVTTNGNVLYFRSHQAWHEQVKKCTYTARVENGNVVVGYPELEEVYLPPDNGRGHGEYVEV
jgi:hypothetical protein